ncbi:MAG TPA: beta-galactosidase [Bryobacteraceae bacterium]|nr:beta-galactosidase [Bryobacteraceae bacterium]
MKLLASFAFLSVLLPAAHAASDTILYGAAYYHEYMPYERLAKDVELMKKANLSVVRVGESTWSSWEPRDGEFQFAWMDRIVDAMHAAGIRVIMGTPTYSIPTWLYRKHPEIAVLHQGALPPQFNPWQPSYPSLAPPGAYGPRQNIDLTNPDYLRYSERVIRKIAERYAKHPAVIGWQVDNETAPNGLALPHVQQAFVERLKKKYGTPQKLNELWGLSYWGQLVDSWDDLPSREGILNSGYKLEWDRFQRSIVTDFLNWQASIIREYKRPDQFVTHDLVGGLRPDVDPWAIARNLDVIATNIYYVPQDRMDGYGIALGGDAARSFKQRNYLVTETNAQAIGWDSRAQFPPFDGQLRLGAFAHVASGAGLVAYWHWHSLHYGQETYWRGVLGHDLEPNRAYAEVSRIGADLKRIGPELAGLTKQNRVAILYSADSQKALTYMPFSDRASYMTFLDQMYGALYRMNVETDFVTPETENLGQYRVLLVPPLYAASDAALERLARFVEQGGHVVMALKSGFANEHATVRAMRAPGPLRKAAGFSYQEFSNLVNPLPLKPDTYSLGEDSSASVWAEFLTPEAAQVLATYDHPFFGRFAAVTRNKYGKGTLTYAGTVLTDQYQQRLIREALEAAGVTGPDQQAPAGVCVRHGRNGKGRTLHFYLNFTGQPQSLAYAYGDGTELLAARRLGRGERLALAPWDVAVVEESGN